MRTLQRTDFHSLWLSTAACLLAACMGHTPATEDVPLEGQPFAPRHLGGHLTVGPGEPDLANRHQASILIKASDDSLKNHICSGVLINSNLVLTAAHCVCSRGRRIPAPAGMDRLLFDKSSCQRNVTVVTYIYNPHQENLDQLDADNYDRTLRHYSGKVEPHSDFRITLIKPEPALANIEPEVSSYYVETARADLALVFLTTNVEGDKQSIELPESEVAVGETVEMVGYGVGFSRQTPEQQTINLRRVGENTFKDKKDLALPTPLQSLFLDAEKLVFDNSGSLTLSGDSGGPCLRRKKAGKNKTVFVLAGIASWSTATESIFISVYFHRSWLQERKSCSQNERCRTRVLEQGEEP